MAKSSGGMNFNINLNGVDKFLADAARSDDALKRILDTLDKISRGNNLQKYWADQYKSIEGLVDAFEKASKHLGDDGKVRWMPTMDAEELIKSINAFAAHSKQSFDDVASMMSERFGEGTQAVISAASEAAHKLDSAFSIKSMQDAFAALDEMRKASAESVEMLGRLDSASTKRLQQELRNARQELFETQSQLQEFQQIWDRIGSGGDVNGVIDQIDTLEKRIQGIRDTAHDEFETFLNGNDISSNFGGAQKYFDQISNGSMTARQAIIEFKAEFANMFDGGASGEMDAVYSMFTQIRDEISRIPGMLESVITSMHDMGAFSGEAEKTSESLQRVEERTTAIANSGADLQPMADAIANIASGIKETGDGSASTLASLQGIVEAIGRLGNIDSGSLTNISMMLRSIASMNGFTASSKGLDTLVETLDKLSRFSDTSALVGLSSIDLSKLKVSKAALENLATYLPQIQGVDVSPLQKLANINWANLDGLRLTKTNLENVTNLIEKTGIKADTSGLTGVQSEFDKIGTSLDGLQEKIRTTFDLSNAISQASELASQYAGVKAALDTAAVAAASSSAGGGRGGRAAADSPDELQRLINLYVQYYDALKRIENARNSNDPYNEAYFTDVARGIETLIASIEKENDSLREQANATQSVQRAMQSWMELVNRNQAKADNKTAEQYRKEAEMAREAESAIRKKNEAEAASIAKQAAEDEARALQEVISQYEKYYDLEAKRINAESSGQTQVATYYRDQATAVKELINSIETLLPDLADQARRSSEVASAISGYNLAVAKSGSAEEQKNVKALIDLYVKLYAARTDVAKAYAAGGNNEATEIARQRAAAIKAEIDAIVGENAELDKQAQANTRVADAIYKHNAAINALNTDKIKQESAEIEKYKQQLDSLSQLNITGKNAIQFAGDETSVERYKAALAELQARFDAIGVASKDTRAQAVADFDAQRQKVEELRKSLNQAAKDQSAASNLANKIELYASKNGAAPLAMRQQWQQWISELRNGDAVARGTVSSIDAEFKRLQNTIRTTSAGGKTFFQQMKEGWSKFGGWSLVTRSFTKVISIMKQAVTAVKEVDSAMTELRKVTNATAAGYDRFYKSATETASSVGAKLSDVINASADFARLGFSIEDASELAKVAMLYTNIGDGITDVSVATESIISTMKAFDIEASDAMSIVDKFNEVGKELLPMPVATRCLAECYIGQSSVVKCA